MTLRLRKNGSVAQLLLAALMACGGTPARRVLQADDAAIREGQDAIPSSGGDAGLAADRPRDANSSGQAGDVNAAGETGQADVEAHKDGAMSGGDARAASNFDGAPWPQDGAADTTLDVAAPGLSVTPPALAFAGTTVGETVKATVSIRNTGVQTLILKSVSDPGSPFKLLTPPAIDSTLAPDGNRDISISFAPEAAGRFAADMRIETSAGVVTVAMVGLGQSKGHLTITPVELQLGDVQLGTHRRGLFQVANDGTGPLKLLASRAPDAFGFQGAGSLKDGTILMVGASVVLGVVFAPGMLGSASASWEFTTDDNQGSYRVPVTAVGAPAFVGPVEGGRWQLNGSAVLAGGALQLTAAAVDQAGSAFWPEVVQTGHLLVSFDAELDSGTGADGLTLAFADADAGALPTALGAKGSGLGFSGIKGVAVGLLTHVPPVPVAGRVLVANVPGAVAGSLKWLATSPEIPGLRGTKRQITVTLVDGTVSVWLDAAFVLSVSLASIPARAYVGFTGSTGAFTDRHAVSNVSVVPNALTLPR